MTSLMTSLRIINPENFSLLTLEKAHFGGYLMPDVLILKLWFAVHRMLHGCATNYVSYPPYSLKVTPMRFKPRMKDTLRQVDNSTHEDKGEQTKERMT